MRKFVSILAFMCIVMAGLGSAILRAEAFEYVEGKRVYDYAGLFSDSESARLEEYALSIENAARTEFYVLTINDAEGKSSMDYADDFGDNGAFGYEKKYGTYIVMLIDMDNREVYISTSGNAIEYLNDYRINKTLDAVFEYMPDGEYYKAAMAYLETAYKYMTTEPSHDYKEPDYYEPIDDTYYYDDGTYEEVGIGSIFVCSLGISAIVSAIVLLVMISGAKTKMAAGSRTYMGGSGLRINRKEDIFTHTTTVKRKIQTNNGSSGGGGHSSVHRSSGGHSHGGGGRKF